MTEPFELERVTPLLVALTDRAAAAGLYLIARAQEHRSYLVVVNNGRTEEVVSSRTAGIGLHVFTDEGICAFGSTDGFRPGPVLDLLDRTAGAARAAHTLGAAANLGFLHAAPTRVRIPSAGRVPIETVSLPEVERQALELNGELRSLETGLAARTSLSLEREEWRVVRSDGTDAAWIVPRFTATQSATAGGPGASEGAFTCRATISSPHFDALRDSKTARRLALRARTAARRAADLPAAAKLPASRGVALLIDYALAKGLAHEAFGHAAEADQFRSSVLARDGRFRRGERVGRDGVSVIDEPIRGDHADQPVSANGEPRQRVEIVRSGVLAEALTDMFSARPAGLEPKGCERAESYRCAPIPRMSSMRIEIAGAGALPRPFEEMSIEEVRDLMGESGVLDRHSRVIYLAGYTGGQVNPIQGDFTFNCQALYELTARCATMFRPSSFRGSILAALASLQRGFGPLQLDAIGSCGKWGQSVPSSGGSHALVLFEPDERIGLGT